MNISITDRNGKTQPSIDLDPGEGMIISAGSAELAISVVRQASGGLKITGPFNVNNRTVEIDRGGVYILMPSGVRVKKAKG